MSTTKTIKTDSYTPPPCPPHGYSFVAAASLFKSFGGICIYVKYKSADPHKITIKDQSGNHIWYICPDREIVIVRNGQEMDSFYPWGESFDEVYDFNIFNDSVSRQLGIEYIMTNYAHSKGTSNPRIASRIPDDKRINVLSDSGGLQVARDMIAPISPVELIEFYNENVDAGMVLDLPLSISTMDMIKKAAHLQKKSTDIMLERAKGVELLNIFHGHNIEQRREYRKIVEDERIPRCAVGGLYRHGLLAGVNIMHDLVNTGMKYKQYHMLGIFGSLHIPVMIKMANVGWKPHITSDSTSHIQSASNKAYHFQFDLYHTSKRIPIGSRGSIPNTSKILPCQCEVCRVLKYTDVLAFGANRFTLELLSIHNAIEMSRYTRQLQEAAEALTSKEFNELIYMQLKRHPQLQQVKQAMDFIDLAEVKGIEAARKKYHNQMDTVKEKAITITGTLFGFGNSDVEQASTELQTAEEKKARVMTRMAGIEKVLDNINAEGIGLSEKQKAKRGIKAKEAPEVKAVKASGKKVKDEEISIDVTGPAKKLKARGAPTGGIQISKPKTKKRKG